MPTIRVKISDEEKKALREYGPLSDAVREGLTLYLQTKKTGKALAKLRALQAKDRAKTTTLEELKLIREGIADHCRHQFSCGNSPKRHSFSRGRGRENPTAQTRPTLHSSVHRDN